MYYTVTDYYDPIGEKKISSTCPACGKDNCLELRFFQKRIESPFSKTVTKKVSAILFCLNMQTEIPPVQWNDEIENYFKTEKSKLRLQPRSLKFTKYFYALLIIPIIAITVFIGFNKWQHKQYNDLSAQIEQVKTGDKVAVMYNLMKNGQITTYGNTWFQIKKINTDTIFLQRHKDFNSEEGFIFNLDTKHFTEEIIKASLPRFKERNLSGFDYTNMTFTGYITDIEKPD